MAMQSYQTMSAAMAYQYYRQSVCIRRIGENIWLAASVSVISGGGRRRPVHRGG